MKSFQLYLSMGHDFPLYRRSFTVEATDKQHAYELASSLYLQQLDREFEVAGSDMFHPIPETESRLQKVYRLKGLHYSPYAFFF